MELIKPGRHKYKTEYLVPIYWGKCGLCDAEFEIQSAEMGIETGGGYFTFACPYCRQYHSNYRFRKLREDWIDESKLEKIDYHYPKRQTVIG